MQLKRAQRRGEISEDERAWILHSPHFFILPLELRIALARKGDPYEQQQLFQEAAEALKRRERLRDSLAQFIAVGLDALRAGQEASTAFGYRKRGVSPQYTQHAMREAVFSYEWASQNGFAPSEQSELVAAALLLANGFSAHTKDEPVVLRLVCDAVDHGATPDLRVLRQWRRKLLDFDAERRLAHNDASSWVPPAYQAKQLRATREWLDKLKKLRSN